MVRSLDACVSGPLHHENARRTSKSLSDSGDKCLFAITSARRTSKIGVAFNERTEPTMPVALGGDKIRNGTLTRFHTG